MIDTHTHLNMDLFDDDLDQVIEKAKSMGVEKILVIGMDHEANLKAIEISNRYEMAYATVGIHPASVNDSNIDAIKPLLKHKKVVAIGECGLDYYWVKDNKNLQKKFFQAHIDLALETKLPLVIHTRDSFLDAYHMLLPHKGLIKGVFHCFSSNLEDAKKAIDLGFYIGVDGPITYKNNQDIKHIVEHIDLKHILVETDSPYLTPVPFRGKRNEPGYTKYVVEKIAEIKKLEVHEVSKITSKNAMDLFQLGGNTE
jgi:TatD DNase family protein